jgi:2-haloacid dehalogenase
MTAVSTQPKSGTRDVTFKPKYITFDCYGTLTNFRMADVAREMYADRVAPARMDQFVKDFAQYRLDEVMGDWRPYDQILENAIRRTCRRNKVEYREGEGRKYYDAVPTWGPHPDVSEPLSRIAKEIPLVILSNAMDEQIHHNVAKLGAPFHRVYTAQQAQAYKPRLSAFEYMLSSSAARRKTSCTSPPACVTTTCRPPTWASATARSWRAATSRSTRHTAPARFVTSAGCPRSSGSRKTAPP